MNRAKAVKTPSDSFASTSVTGVVRALESVMTCAQDACRRLKMNEDKIKSGAPAEKVQKPFHCSTRTGEDTATSSFVSKGGNKGGTKGKGGEGYAKGKGRNDSQWVFWFYFISKDNSETN